MNFDITLLFYYLLGINLVSGIIFYSDKLKAQKKKRRIPEKTLHIWEFAGGALANLILMYSIRHKNQKSSYYIYTYFAILAWFLVFYLLYK